LEPADGRHLMGGGRREVPGAETPFIRYLIRNCGNVDEVLLSLSSVTGVTTLLTIYLLACICT